MKDVSLITYPAADLAKAKQFFRELTGTQAYADSPYYVGYKCGNVEIGLVPSQQGGAIAFWTVDDIAASVKALVDAGRTSRARSHQRSQRTARREHQRPKRYRRRLTTVSERLGEEAVDVGKIQVDRRPSGLVEQRRGERGFAILWSSRMRSSTVSSAMSL